MANFRSLPFSIVLLLLLTSLIMANSGGGSGEGQQEEVSLQAKCGSLDPCNGCASNHDCCKAIADCLAKPGCSYVCNKLKTCAGKNLTTKCYENRRCTICNQCPCKT